MKINSIHFILTVSASLLFACRQNGNDVEKKILRNDSSGSINSQMQIACMLDSFNIAATKANFDGYFKYFTEDATFMGTDATEHWDKKNFMIWAKPYFEKKRTWNFKSIERHIYFAKSGDFAWFDELLNTQMKICRGSGVVVK